MNGIIGMTQIAMQHLDEKDRVRDCLNKVDESSRLLMEMINEVLDMARIESGKTQLHSEVVMLRELMDGVVDVCKTGVLQAKHDLTVDIEALGDDCVMTDPVHLSQIFMNIISNSVKYTQEIFVCGRLKFRKIKSMTIVIVLKLKITVSVCLRNFSRNCLNLFQEKITA